MAKMVSNGKCDICIPKNRGLNNQAANVAFTMFTI